MQAITKRFFIVFILLTAFTAEAYEQVRGGTIVRRRVIEAEDSIIYEEEDTTTKISSHLRDMSGNWQLVSMKKQPGLPPEKLEGYFLNIQTDSTFTGRTPCGSFSGSFRLRGTAIRFEPQKSPTVGCAQEPQETIFFNLLKGAVVTFGVFPKNLELRGASARVIFEAIR
jgi:heat shock protein HslJ